MGKSLLSTPQQYIFASPSEIFHMHSASTRIPVDATEPLYHKYDKSVTSCYCNSTSWMICRKYLIRSFNFQQKIKAVDESYASEDLVHRLQLLAVERPIDVIV